MKSRYACAIQAAAPLAFDVGPIEMTHSPEPVIPQPAPESRDLPIPQGKQRQTRCVLRMTNPIQHLGIAIDNIARCVYRHLLGVCIPAASIRLADIEADRQFVLQRLETACADVAYWRGELERTEEMLDTAQQHLATLRSKRRLDNRRTGSRGA